ncbi:hypothetical protein PPACK8108_LOCUS17787 [Phakopsora pachyrhizi]|uniref:Uncharacterized protein n=1 Tax=Phakopsora pachyrhizi TaxID=170000 RepID=A0AAV0BC72_PHAPC|nr:hypothetical protein PPACK8108_LOCUS17787 [Phakopsora pachyrhizi]
MWRGGNKFKSIKALRRFGKGGQGKGGAWRRILLDFTRFEEEGVAGAHQGQSAWSKTTGATDL